MGMPTASTVRADLETRKGKRLRALMGWAEPCMIT